MHRLPAKTSMIRDVRPYQARVRRNILYNVGGEIHCRPVDQPKYAVDLTQHETFSGIPQSAGLILLEKNPAMEPFKARGYGWQPGWFQEARNTAQVEGAMEEMVSAVEATPIKMSFDDTPPWLADRELAFERHREWAERVWWIWNQPGNDWVRWFAQQAMRATPWYGFFLAEIVADEVWWKLPGDKFPRKYWVPKPPQWIAPWSVHRWVTCGDNLVGVELIQNQEIDWFGNTGESYAILPAEKFIHNAARPMGPNWEGRSHFRSSYQLIRMMRDALQTEALGHEAHGIGMTYVEEPPSGLSEQQRDDIDDQFANAKSSHVPFIRGPAGMKISVLSPASQLKEMGGSINRLNQAILMGIGAEGKLIGLTAGSNAARASAAEDAWRPFAPIGHNYVVQPLNRLFARMMAYNFPEDDYHQQARLSIGSVEKQSASDIINTLAIAKEKGLLDNPVTKAIVEDALGIDLGAFGSGGIGEGAGI